MKTLLINLKYKVQSAYRYIRDYLLISIDELKKWVRSKLDEEKSPQEYLNTINTILQEWGLNGKFEIEGDGAERSEATDKSGSVATPSNPLGA